MRNNWQANKRYMSVLESFLIGDFLVGDPPASYIFRHLLVKDLFFVTNKTRVAKFPFPTLLVRPGNWKSQYVY